MSDSKNPNFELPPPASSVEVFTPNNGRAEINEVEPSKVELTPLGTNSPNKENTGPVQVPTTNPQVVSATAVSDDSSTSSVSSAQDLDVMEKEWVDKAKQVVSRTRNDPRAQNNELAKIKAEYIKSRFQKTIKVEEDK